MKGGWLHAVNIVACCSAISPWSWSMLSAGCMSRYCVECEHCSIVLQCQGLLSTDSGDLVLTVQRVPVSDAGDRVPQYTGRWQERGREPEGERGSRSTGVGGELGLFAWLANLNIPGLALFFDWLAGRTFLASLANLQECVKVPCSQNLRKATITELNLVTFRFCLPPGIYCWHMNGNIPVSNQRNSYDTRLV